MNEKPIELRIEYWASVAKILIEKAEADGVIITVERVPQQPLAMRNHVAHIEVREKR